MDNSASFSTHPDTKSGKGDILVSNVEKMALIKPSRTTNQDSKKVAIVNPNRRTTNQSSSADYIQQRKSNNARFQRMARLNYYSSIGHTERGPKLSLMEMGFDRGVGHGQLLGAYKWKM